MRKTPIRHTVGRHKRRGSWVGSYERGSGIRNKRSRVVGKRVTEDTPMEELGFVVNLKYSDKPGDGESLIILGDTYEKVLDETFDEKADPRMPISVELIDPDLDQILKFIGEGAKKAGKYTLKGMKKAGGLGAKYAIKGGHVAKQIGMGAARATVAGLKESSRLALYDLERRKVRAMLKLCYTGTEAEKISARAALKRFYPDIYDVTSFSRDSRRRRRRVPEVFVLPRRYRSQMVV